MSDPNVPPPPYGQPPYGQPQYGQPQNAPQPQYAPPPPYAPPGPTGPPPKSKGNTGCVVAIVIVLVLFVGGGIAAVVGLNWAANKATDAIGSVRPCPYVSDADATEAVGTDAHAELFTGLGKVLNLVDDRVLPAEESCILSPKDDGASSNSGGMPGLGRVVKYSGGDAASRYQAELTKAQGTTEDRGNGVSIETASYYNKDVPGLGDEAFCTTTSMTTSGVLARQGDTLVYVSLVEASDVPPGVDLSDPDHPKLGTDDANCDASQVLARKILSS